MVTFAKYLAWPSQRQTTRMVILWWEGRRLWYNAILLTAITAGSLTLSLIVNAPYAYRKYLEGAAKFTLLSLLFIQIPANVWFTGGWIAQLLLRKLAHRAPVGFGPWALAIGTGFSLLFITSIYICVGSFVLPNRRSK